MSAKDLRPLLPPELGPVDFYEERAAAAAVKCRGWKSFEPSLRMVGKRRDAFEVSTDLWLGTMQYYGGGDFDADGYEDLLVQISCRPRDGSYGVVKLVLLT